MAPDWELEVVEEEDGDVIVVYMDVAKSNVFSLANMDAMDRALDRIEKEEKYQAHAAYQPYKKRQKTAKKRRIDEFVTGHGNRACRQERQKGLLRRCVPRSACVSEGYTVTLVMQVSTFKSSWASPPRRFKPTSDVSTASCGAFSPSGSPLLPALLTRILAGGG